ncbi:MAG: CoB--CoM heterodisulfide reductase [Bacteroidetes bacterium 4572_117]|nr:MAG: CoB--CoM heterodisulfide reductase [Bacteroidetes bacterium 4572_117]
MKVPVMAELAAQDKKAEYLFWVGSAGSYDDRAKKITRAFAKILEHCKVSYAVLGTEETDSGAVARRAGNEFLFQMQAMQNIETLKMYDVKKIITCDPHEFNTFKNEYPDLGGNYEIYHHSQFIEILIAEGKLTINDKEFTNKRITYHDPCYLGRGNEVYEAPRAVLSKLNGELVEMKQNRGRSLCCGAGGAQMFKEAEAGNKEIYELRTEQAVEQNPDFIATACPFCMTMMQDGIKMIEKQDKIQVLDIAEIIERSKKL